MACRREVPFGHLASAKSLYPLGQPEKALGHEPQIDPCVANRQPPGLSASGTNPRRRYLIKMQRRWKHKINEGCQGQLATKRLSARRGLEVKLSFLLPVEGEIFFLTSPFIEQAITLKFRSLSIHFTWVRLDDECNGDFATASSRNC